MELIIVQYVKTDVKSVNIWITALLILHGTWEIRFRWSKWKISIVKRARTIRQIKMRARFPSTLNAASSVAHWVKNARLESVFFFCSLLAYVTYMLTPFTCAHTGSYIKTWLPPKYYRNVIVSNHLCVQRILFTCFIYIEPNRELVRNSNSKE